MVPLSPDEQARLDQKFVRKVVIGDLRCGTLQEGTGFDEFIKQDLFASSSEGCSFWGAIFAPEGEPY